MIKTIKGKMIFLQTIMFASVLGLLLVIFILCAEDYYMNKKMEVMEHAFKNLKEKNLADFHDGDNDIIYYEEQKLKFVISDENFKQVYITAKGKGIGLPFNSQRAQYKIKNSIINKLDKYQKNEFITHNGHRKLNGRGIISQKGHLYYVYIYEIKTGIKIKFSYYVVFFGAVVVMAVVLGVIISIFIANKISRPIKQIELNTRLAVKNGYDIKINEDQEFKELSGLAQSINTMISQIRSQIGLLEQEIQRKEQTDNMKKQFVNNISHEMKTPLAIISSQAEMIQYLEDGEKRKEYSESIIEETKNMSQMINDMISIFTIQSEEEVLTIVNVDISDLVRGLCRGYSKLFDANYITLREEYDINAEAQVNEKLIKQAVSNYISNAIKHSKKDEEVTVRVLSLEDKVRIEVENQGKHIAEDYKDKIWDIFYSGDESESLNGQKSSGLGLYLVKSIAELHDAEYGVENIDSGVRFYLTLHKVQK